MQDAEIDVKGRYLLCIYESVGGGAVFTLSNGGFKQHSEMQVVIEKSGLSESSARAGGC